MNGYRLLTNWHWFYTIKIDSKLLAIDRLGGELFKIDTRHKCSRLDQVRPRRQELEKFLNALFGLSERVFYMNSAQEKG